MPDQMVAVDEAALAKAEEFIEQATEKFCAIEMEGSYKVAEQREREADAAFPGDWPATQAEA